MLDEQINSVRRELDNLKKMGFLRSRTKNRKKFYFVNQDFIFFEELKSIFTKAQTGNEKIIKEIKKLGDVQLLVLSGYFVEHEDSPVDLLVIGNLDRNILDNYIDDKVKPNTALRFTIMDPAEFKYRLECNDQFISQIVNDPQNKIVEF